MPREERSLEAIRKARRRRRSLTATRRGLVIAGRRRQARMIRQSVLVERPLARALAQYPAPPPRSPATTCTVKR